jgi:hypothetical protein
MTQEDKQLLLKDLCARLPYGVKVQVADYKTPVELSHINTKNGNGRKPYCFVFAFEPERVKPFLRPMSNMNEEEEEQWEEFMVPTSCFDYENNGLKAAVFWDELSNAIDWLNAHHFDYRGLIEKGLALEAPEGMYK